MTSAPFKVCPECGIEHVRSALTCADCGVELVFAGAEPAEPAPTAAPLPPASELVQIATGSPWELERVALGLQRAGLSCRIDAAAPEAASGTMPGAPAQRARGAAARLGLFVRPEDAADARDALRELLAPDGAHADAPAEGAELDACPACGTPLAAHAAACAECGLEFVPVGDE